MLNLTRTKNHDNKGRQALRLVGGLLLTLLIAACSSAAPTATSTPVPTNTAVPEASVTPSVTVADQEIVGDTVIVAQVVSDGPGWLVIHADADGKPGPVLGQTAVQDGENADVVVELALEGRTETFYAMLHTDAGALGTYEFPGDDVPVSVDGQVVTPAFKITGGLADVTPAVTGVDQEIKEGKVVIAEVVSAGPGWLVIHADADGKPGPILGYAAVQDGANTDVMVELAAEGRTETLYAMLHMDAGEIGAYEFPGKDGPVSVDGQVVTPAFKVTGGLTVTTPMVTVEDQELVDGTVTIAQVVSDGPGWLVIHADADGKPGPVLGQAAVQDGENAEIVVALDLTGVTGVLHAMLHTDAGEIGAYEFPGDDVPVQQDDAIVMAPLSLRVAEDTAEIAMINFSFSPAQLVVHVGTTVTWTNNDDVNHSTTSDDGVWDSGLFGGGESFSFVFNEPGVYPYYCQPHGGPGGEGMSGTVVVIGGAEQTAATSETEHEHDDEHTVAETHGVPEEAAAVPNPIKASADSLFAGATLFGANCAVCHGENGLGDGPTAASLDPKPANLHKDHVQELSDGALFYIVSHGVSGTAMLAWEDTLSAEEIWHLINFVRTFAGE